MTAGAGGMAMKIAGRVAAAGALSGAVTVLMAVPNGKGGGPLGAQGGGEPAPANPCAGRLCPLALTSAPGGG
jgi:hypothetical protein